MKNILTTTALVLSFAAPAFAESHSATDGAATDNTMSSETTATDTMAVDTMAVVAIGTIVAEPTDLFASDLIGKRIYNVESGVDVSIAVAAGSETEWDDIGEINDIIVTADGEVSAVILGVGGFIGIGERDVSVPMSAITIVQQEGDSGDYFLVVKTSKEELEAAPAFDRSSM